jgi:hypothetical protein
MNTTTIVTLNKPTQILFQIAVHSHTLRQYFGVQVVDWDNHKLSLTNIPRPWLVVEHPSRPYVYCCDSDKFSVYLRNCSPGQRHMFLWILNVWNPGYAKSKGWDFDLFDALCSLDSQNREAIASWSCDPIWP